MADEITREEQFLSAAAGNEVNLPTPITREEMFLAKAAGVNINITMLDPITRKERYLHALAESGGGSSVDVEPLSVTENGEYSEEGVAYSPVTVNVPNSYTQSDEGKVVSNGALVAQSSDTVTENDTYDTTLINSLTVNVSGGGASNVIMGSFAAVDNNVFSISLDYSGNGYPIALAIWADKGAKNTDDSSWSAMPDSTVTFWAMCKSKADVSPSYNDDNAASNQAIYLRNYKNGSNVSYGSSTAVFYTQSIPDSLSNRIITFSDKKTLKVAPKGVTSTRTSFVAELNYNYCVIYSE